MTKYGRLLSELKKRNMSTEYTGHIYIPIPIRAKKLIRLLQDFLKRNKVKDAKIGRNGYSNDIVLSCTRPRTTAEMERIIKESDHQTADYDNRMARIKQKQKQRQDERDISDYKRLFKKFKGRKL